ncbi:Putative F-box protein At4g38870 [Linum perenne]
MADRSKKGIRRRRIRTEISRLRPKVWKNNINKDAYEQRRKKRKDELKKKKNGDCSSLIPDNDLVITQILSRVSPKSIIRFKCVCKNWKSVIEQDSNFINLHRTHSPPRTSLLTIVRNQGCYDFLSADLDLVNGVCGGNYVRGASIQSSRRVLTPDDDDVHLLGPVKGLLCFVHEFDVLVYNVITGQAVTPWIRSTVVTTRRRTMNCRKRVCEFGFDPETGSHKVIFLWDATEPFSRRRKTLDSYAYCEVLTVGVDSNWRIINDVAPCKSSGTLSAYANGCIYFITSSVQGRDDYETFSEFLMSFDVGSETFRMIGIPRFTMAPCLTLLELDGCLTMVRGLSSPQTHKMWKFHDHGKKKAEHNGTTYTTMTTSEGEDWSEVSIKAPRDIPPWDRIFYHPITGNDEMMIIEAYDDEQNFREERNYWFVKNFWYKIFLPVERKNCNTSMSIG